MPHRTGGHLFTLAIAGLIVATVTCGPALREDEVQCEEAVAHMQSCCPGGFPEPQTYCRYTAGACNDSRPALSVEESQCIQKTDCATLVNSGVCERAKGHTTQNGPVCP